MLVANSHCDGHVEDVFDTVLLFTTALHVHGAHLLGYSPALVGSDGGEALGLEQLDAVLLVAQIGFEPKEHERRCRAEVEDLWIPLGVLSAVRLGGASGGAYLVHDILERVGAVDGEADEDDVGLGVGEGPQPVVLLLAGSVPESKLDHLARGRVGGVGDVVLKDGGHIFLAGISITRASAAGGAHTSGKLPEL